MFDSVAVFVTRSRVSSLTVCVAMRGKTGAAFSSATITVKVSKAIRRGLAMSDGSVSVTEIVTMLVPGLWTC